MNSRFTVQREVATGGQGRVFAVADAARGGTTVALKETLAGGGHALAREFGLLTRLCHPHLVAVHDWFERSPLRHEEGSTGLAAYTQDWVNGERLTDAIRPLGEPERVEVFRQVLSALAYLHALDVVHLDLKPDNVLVSSVSKKQPYAHVLDFGIATSLRDSQTASSRMGSLSYMAPERLSGDSVDVRADLYALGVLMVEVSLGRPPSRMELHPNGASTGSASRRHFIETCGVPTSWVETVLALTAAEPDHRPSGATEAAALWGRDLGCGLELVTPSTVAAILRSGPPVGRDATLERCRQALDGQPVVLTGPEGIGRQTVARHAGRNAQAQGRWVEFWPLVPEVASVADFCAALERVMDPGAVVAAPTLSPDATETADPEVFSQAVKASAMKWVNSVKKGDSRTPRGLFVVDHRTPLPPLVGAMVESLVSADVLPFGLIVTAPHHATSANCSLAPLDRDAVSAFVASRMGFGELTERFAASLTSASGGSPLRLQSLLALLAQRGAIAYDGVRWRWDAGAMGHDLPGDLESAVTERVNLLSATLRDTLAALVWLRFPSSVESVAAVVGSVVHSVALSLAHLEASGLIWAGGNGRYQVGHPILRNVIGHWEPPQGACAAHDDVLAAGRVGPLAAAWHTGGERGARDAVAIGTAAVETDRLGRSEVAASLAVELAPDLPEALELRARVANLLGPRDVQVRCLEALIAVLPHRGRRRLQAEESLFWALTRVGDAPRAEAVGLRVVALAEQEEDEGLLAESLVHLANVVIQRGEYDRGQHLLERAVELARAHSLLAVQARASNNLGNICAYRDDYAGALERYGRALNLKREEGDPVGQRIALGNMGLMALNLRRYGEAQEHFAESLAVARRIGHRRGEAWSLLALAVLGLEGGRPEYALRRATAALELARELGDQLIACDAENTTAEAYIALARRDDAEAAARRSLVLAEAVDSSYNLANARATLASALLDTQPEQADAVAALCLLTPQDAVSRALALQVRAEVALSMGDLDSARSYIDDALAVGGRGHGPKVLRCAISVLQTCGDIQASEQVAAMARRIVLECAEQWPTDPRDDGAELRGTLDGPSRASFLNIPDVVWILAQTAEMKAAHGEPRPFHSVTTKALKTRAGEGGMTQETEGGPGPHGVPGWEVMATAPAGDKMGDLVAQWLHAFIRHMRAERGFVVRASGDIVAARDLDGEVISSARRKLPEAAVQKALEQGTPWRAQGETGGAVLALPVTFASVSPDEGVEHWVVVLQNRFVPDAFEPRLEGSDLAPWLGPLMVLARLDALGRLVAENRLRLADAEKRQQREHTRSTEEILRLRRELETTREHVGPAHDYSEIVFESAPMKRMLLRVDRIIDTALPVYVLGESGTGKELIARAIHGQGPRREGPFVAQNCSAIPASLFESQFFGHERGAFTGAERANEGLFRRASGGTLFLDEIGDLPLDLQAKLLRVLETSEVRPLGGRRTFKVDVRIICATHRDLKMLVETKRFREDLYYRLNVVRVDVPPLRDRPDDIAPLVQHFLQGRIGPGNPLPQLGPGVAKALVRYDWPGNVRQLENEMTRAALLCDGMIQLADLSEEVRASRGGSAAKRLGGLEGGFAGTLRLDRGTMKDRVGRLETWVLSDALERHGGNKSSVARELGLSRAGLNMKLKRLALWETKET